MSKLNVKRIRGELSQSQFAELLGVSVRTLQDWEQGRHAPNAAAVALLRLAETGVLKRKSVVTESIEAISKVTSRKELRQGLANTMLAVARGEITSKEADAIRIAAHKRKKGK